MPKTIRDKWELDTDSREMRLSTRLKMSNKWLEREELIREIEALERRLEIAQNAVDPRFLRTISRTIMENESLFLKNQRLLNTLGNAVQGKKLSECKRVYVSMVD